MMAPKFIRDLLPRRKERGDGRPLLTVLKAMTWLQWAMFFSGYVGVNTHI
jgi:SHS family lactate transporter-like MFS transporter